MVDKAGFYLCAETGVFSRYIWIRLPILRVDASVFSLPCCSSLYMKLCFRTVLGLLLFALSPAIPDSKASESHTLPEILNVDGTRLSPPADFPDVRFPEQHWTFTAGDLEQEKTSMTQQTAAENWDQVLLPHFDSAMEDEPAIPGEGDFGGPASVFQISAEDLDLETPVRIWPDEMPPKIAGIPGIDPPVDHPPSMPLTGDRRSSTGMDRIMEGNHHYTKPTITISVNPSVIFEGESAEVTVTLSKPLNTAANRHVLATRSSTAIPDRDYTLPRTFGPTFNGMMFRFDKKDQVTSGPQIIKAELDDLVEGDEYLHYTGLVTSENHGDPSGGAYAFRVNYKCVNHCKFTLTIKDRLTTVKLSASPNPVSEGSRVTITAEISGAQASDSNVEIPLTIAADTAEPEDYGSLTDDMITMTGTGATRTGTTIIQLPDEADANDWDDEIFTVAIDETKLPSTVTAGDPKSVEITITDDDKPAVRFTLDPTSVHEGENATVTAILTKPLLGDVTIPFLLYDQNYERNKPAKIVNPQAPDQLQIEIKAGDMSGVGTVTTNADTNDENEEVHILLARLPPEVEDSREVLYRGLIIQDAKRAVTLSASPNPAPEGATVTVTAELSYAYPQDLTIPLILREGTAKPAEDYENLSMSNIVISGGSTTGTLDILITDDTKSEPSEEFTVAIDKNNLPSAVTAGDPESVKIMIDDDDAPLPSVTLSIVPVRFKYPVDEGKSVEIKAELSERLPNNVKIPLTLTPGTADAKDYGNLTTSEITISRDTWSGSVAIPATIDMEDEKTETFMVTIDESSLPSALTAGDPKSVTVQINDKLTVSWSANPNPVYEGETTTLTLTLSKPMRAGSVSYPGCPPGWAGYIQLKQPIDYSPGGGNMNDYEFVNPGCDDFDVPTRDSKLNFYMDPNNPGYTYKTASIQIYIVDDGKLEGDEELVWRRGGGSTGGFWDIVVASCDPNSDCPYGIIVKDRPTVSLSVEPDSVAEGDPVTVTASITEAQSTDVVVPIRLQWNVASLTAEYEKDYGPITPNPIIIKAGETEATGTIPTIQDEIAEMDEKFRVGIKGQEFKDAYPDLKIWKPGFVPAWILDDDRITVTLSAARDTVYEGESTELTLELSDRIHAADPSEDAYIEISRNGSSTAGDDDYEKLSPSEGAGTDVWRVEFALGDPLKKSISIVTRPDDEVEGSENLIWSINRTSTNAHPDLGIPVADCIPEDCTATIVIREKPSVLVSVAPNPVPEGEEVEVTVTVSEALSDALTIPLTLTAGTAEAGDYGNLDEITIPASALTGTGTISTTQDEDEEDETFTVALGDLPLDLETGMPSSVEVTILEPRQVSISATTPVTEGEEVTVTVTLSQAFSNPVTIPLTLTAGTAEDGDYGSLPEVLIPADALSETGIISTVEDADEDDETFTVALGDLPVGVSEGASPLVEVTILERRQVNVSATTPVNEGEDVIVTVMLSKAFPSPVTIPLTLTPGTAEEDDYGNLASITIAADALTGTGTITTAKDADYDDETFTVALGSLPAGVGEGTSPSVDVKILERPRVHLEANPNPVDEGKAVTVTATLSSTLPAPVTIPLTLTPGTAEKGDYGNLASITIAADALTGTGTIVTVKDADYDDETFTVSLGSLPSEISEGTPSSILVTITDLDTPPNVHLSANPNPVDEGNSVTVTATLSKLLPNPVTIPLILTPVTADKGDYGNLASITIATDARTGTGTIATVKDADYDDETFTVSLGSLPSTVAAGSPSSVPLTITDLDTPPVVLPSVSLSANPNPVDEGGSVTVTATLSKALPDPLTIPLTLAPVTAEEGDYGNLASITIAANTQTGTGAIATVKDADYDNETFTVSLSSLPSEVSEGSPASILITIRDIDAPPVTLPNVSLSASPNPVSEGDAVTITATLTGELSGPVVIPLTYTPGAPGPTEPTDYVPVPSIRIDSGAQSGAAVMQTVPDEISEGTERLIVALGALPAAVETGHPSEVEITILDDDAPPPVEVTLSVDPKRVEEGASATVTVTLANPLETAVDVPLIQTPYTAEPDDYTPLPYVTVAGGETQGVGQIVTIADNDTDDEQLIVSLGDLDPAILVAGRESSHWVTILDRIPPKAVRVDLSASPRPVREGDAVTITVELSAALPAAVTIPLTLMSGSADAQDYDAQIPSQVTIQSEEIVGTYVIRATDDDIAEDDETFTVQVGELPDGMTAGDPLAVTITDDDAVGIQALPSVSLLEGSSKAFAFSLSSEPLDAVTVTLYWPSGTDLSLAPITRIFTPANWEQAQQVTLTAAEDNDFDHDQVEVILRATGADYTGVVQVLQVTITDNDAPGVDASAQVTVFEEGSETFAVRLAAAPSGVVTIQIPGSAGDLSITPTRLTFTPETWQTPQEVTLRAAHDDDVVNDSETLRLTARGGGYAGIVHPVAVTVIDNDEAGIVAPAELTMQEGTQSPLPVSLAAQPSGTVTIGLAGHAGTQITLDQTSLTFTTTNWNTPQTVMLTAAEDDNDTVDRVDLRFTASGGSDGGITHTTRITITDKGPLTISIWSQQGLENAGSLQLPIELSRATDQVVTVQYASSDDTAEAGLDYTASRGVVIFDPGAIRGVVEIKLLDDQLPEEHETFKVTLSNATRNVIIAQGTGTGTIQDDDGRATLRVEDAQVQSEAGAVHFRVSLSYPQRRMVTAAYRTRDGTARAGEDYEATSGMVTLAPGTTEALIAVRLLKEDLDWEEETFTVHLESAKHAGIEKAVGVATIQESTMAGKKVLGAYAARFVRTASVQVVDALGGRFRRAADGAVCAAAERAEMAQLWYSASSWDPSLGELLAGCRMSQSMPLSSGSLSVWGQGAFRQFNGQGEDALTLRAEVTTGMVGADYRWSTGWLAGVLFVHSRGDGSFEMKKESGEIMSALTGIYPYVSYTRAGWEVWASAGAGRGNAEVLELKGDLTSRFGALGMQGTLVSGGTTRLRYHGDILVTDAEIDEHDITAEVYRIRGGLEASTQITGGIRPYVEANVRQDGGSAETGTGLELGGGVRFANPAWHLRGEVRTQGLVMHTADGFTEWGFSGSLQMGNHAEGLMMRVRPSWGRGQGMSMYRQQTILDAVPMGVNAHRTELELGYGIPWKEGAARSVMGMTQLPQGRMYRLGGELRPWERLSFSVFGLAHGRKAALGDIGVNVQGTLRY